MSLRPRVRRAPLRAAVAGLLIGSVVAAGAACTADADVGSRPSTPPPSSIPETVRRQVVSVPVGSRPYGLALDDRGQVWAVNSGDGTVVRLDEAGELVERRVRVGGTPLRAAWWAGGLWVVLGGRGEDAVVRVDGETGAVSERVYVGSQPEGIVAAFGSVWVALRGSGYVVRLDPRTRAVAESIKVGTAASRITAGGNALWVSDASSGAVVRVDPRDSSAATLQRFPTGCTGPQGMLARDGLLWAACTESQEVVALDERTGEQLREVRVDGRPDSLAPATDGGLWVSLRAGPRLALIEPVNGTIKSRWPVSTVGTPAAGTTDVTYAGNKVWLSAYASGQVQGVDVTPQGR